VAATQRLQRHVGAEPVVHRARDEAVAARATGSAAITTGSPTRTSRAASSRSAGADVDVQALQLDDLLALLGLEQVDRLAADDAGHEPSCRRTRPAGRPGSAGPSRRSGEPEEALLVDVGDDEADLVDVADDGEQRRLLADAGDRGAEPVGRE
jgi:hypothetical protein